MGLSEIKREGEKIIKLKEGGILCYKGNEIGQRGVGFWISSKVEKSLHEFQAIDDRIALIKLELKRKSFITLIQVYAPTAMAEETEIEKFYMNLSNTLSKLKINERNKVILMGDFNSQVGERYAEEKHILGPYNYGKRNESGERLLNFCTSNNLKVVNTYFKKRAGKRWTWVAPNENVKTQIDYFLVPKAENNIIDFNVLSNFQFYSDHKPITVKINTDVKIKNKIRPTSPRELNDTNKKQYEKELKIQIESMGPIDNLEVNKREERINAMIRNAMEKIKQKKEGNETSPPKEINDLIRERQRLIKKGKKEIKEKIKLNVICKLIKRKLREWNETKNNQIIQEILDTTNSTKTIRKNMSEGKHWITNLQDETGNKITDRKNINKTATKFYKNLYKKDKNTECKVNQIQGEIPTILTDEVKAIIQNLKKGKAPGHLSLIHISEPTRPY